MSRDRTLESERERSGGTGAAAGREMPRGGRSGSKVRPRTPAPSDVRDVLTQQLELPRGDAREWVWLGEQPYDLRASEVRTLAAVGAFRVVEGQDVQADGKRDRWHGDLDHLRQAKLVEFATKVLDGHPTTVVMLTREGQSLLERHQRTHGDEPRQAYYSGLAKPRELAHDARLYRAYATVAARLHEAGSRVRRVVLDYELKRDYQRFLQANNRQHGRTSGRPDRSRDEVQEWARAHDLPVVGDHVQFPDVRIEYERPDGRMDHEDLELATEQYNTRQMATKQAAGFQIQRSQAGRMGGAKARRGASPFDPRAAQEVLR
jgi:hypothetical protein